MKFSIPLNYTIHLINVTYQMELKERLLGKEYPHLKQASEVYANYLAP